MRFIDKMFATAMNERKAIPKEFFDFAIAIVRGGDLSVRMIIVCQLLLSVADASWTTT